jgi:hypothetical protein
LQFFNLRVQAIQLLFKRLDSRSGPFSIATAPPFYGVSVKQRPSGDDEYEPAKIFHRLVGCEVQYVGRIVERFRGKVLRKLLKFRGL